jgi:hypothetical protein
LLAWQKNLAAWPVLDGAPNATPFVSLYAGGRLVGCVGNDEGTGGERLARAFLAALSDGRFGGIGAADRGTLSAQVSYVRRMRWIEREAALTVIEPGTHGIGLARAGKPAVSLLPQVARDLGLTARGLLDVLAQKAQVAASDFGGGALFVFETESVAAHEADPARRAGGSAVQRGLAWLRELLDVGPGVVFGIDPRARQVHLAGPMLHGRAAVAIQALRAHRAHGPTALRASRWLAAEVRRGLSRRGVEAWPEHPAMVAGTLALAVLAGIDVTRPLASLASKPEVLAMPWHAAQVVTALGASAPDALYRACVADLERRAWAPWTAMAARARGDGETFARCERALVATIRTAPPHEGGASVTEVPEIAQTAIAVEALARSVSREARAAVRRGRAFLTKWQFRAESIPASLERRLAEGAFPASPVATFLRADITGHAVLALADVD